MELARRAGELISGFEAAIAQVRAGKAAWRIEASDGAADGRRKLDFAAKVVEGPQVSWTMTPEHTMKFAAFMAEVGSIKAPPASWHSAS